MSFTQPRQAWVMKMTTARIMQDLVLIEEDVSDGHQWNVSVISPEEPQRDQPTWVPIDNGWRRAQKYCSVSANWN